MRNPETVSPNRWSKLTILSNDGEFSYAYGLYRHDEDCISLELGGRWNGDYSNPSDVGYPSLGGNPTWFVIDPCMVKAILSELESRAFVAGDMDSALSIFKARNEFGV